MKERILQNMVLKKLAEKGWEITTLKNISDIERNFRDILVKRNAKTLEKFGKTNLSNDEFGRFLSLIAVNKSFSDFAGFFLDDDNQIQTDSGESLYLNIFNKKNWSENVFQVAEEVVDNGKRHDILFLINGLPVANMELKRPNVSIGNAFIQTKEYSKILSSLFKFIQLFIISNGNETRYFANNEDINSKYVFRYSDEKNSPINDIYRFIDHFLETNVFSRYISKYVINKKESKKLIALRGYQVHGAEAAINHVRSSRKNGFLWHATGSGKTITSFKVAQIISQDLNQFDKVIFLVDRKDLDTQTIHEYNSFLNNNNKIEETKNSKILLRQLKSSAPKDKLIISTIQKLNILLKSDDGNIIADTESIKDKKVVFIIDECHRSQFGEMNANIRDHFNNVRYIGFTGTPIFASDDETLQTSDIFDVLLHKYLMPNAIEDGNVLPFQVFYHNESENMDDKQRSQFLKSKNHLNNIVDDIIRFYDKRSINRKYSSLLVLNSVDSLIEIYSIFKQRQRMLSADKNYVPLKISGTFSFQEDYSEKNYSRRDYLKEIIKDFNSMTKSNESIENVANFQNRLQAIIKKENVDPQIDIVLVVDQLLTGFDAKKLNTVYIAKSLKKHSLIQAISRTNRVFEQDKERGIVVSYVPGLRSQIEEAVRIYSDSNNTDHVIKRDYELILKKASEAFSEITATNLEELRNNPKANQKKIIRFIKRVNSLATYYKIIRTIEAYTDESVHRDFTPEKLNDLIKYANILKAEFSSKVEWWQSNQKPSFNPMDSVDLPLFIEGVDNIDSEYIRVLLGHVLGSQARGEIEATREQIEEIKNKMDGTSGGKLLTEVFENLLSKYDSDNTLDIRNTLRIIFDEKEKVFTDDYKLDTADISNMLHKYKLKERYAIDIIEEWIKNSGKINGLSFLESDEAIKGIKDDISDHLDLFKSRQEILGD